MHSSTDRTRSSKNITLIGTIINLLLLILKIAAGILANSRAMIADAIHTITDFATDLITYVGIHMGNKEADSDHPWGHGKYETFAAWLIALSLILVSLAIAWDGMQVIIKVLQGGELPLKPGFAALVAAIASLVIKEFMYRATMAVGKRTANPAVIANAWHHRSDALSSAAVALGIAGASILGDFWTILDPVSALLVSVFIFKAGFGIIREASDVLMEKGLAPELLGSIKTIIEDQPGLSDIHNLRCRMVGSRMVMEMHVRMDGSLSLRDAHQLTVELESRLRSTFGRDLIVTVHMEPV